MTGTREGTKTQRLINYLKEHKEVTNRELIKLFQCGKSTCDDARNIAQVWLRDKPLVKDLPDNEFADLRLYGASYEDIGRWYGVHAATVRKRVIPLIGITPKDRWVGEKIKPRAIAKKAKKEPRTLVINPDNYHSIHRMAWV